MSIPSFAVRQPVLVNLVAISMVLVGALVLSDMHRESLPTMPTGWGNVTTVYVGASPEEIEQLVAIPVENAVASVDDVEEIWATSKEGVSYVSFKFKAAVEDMTSAMMEISNEVNRIDDLPVDAERPIVREFKVDFPTIAVAVRGEVTEAVLRQVGKDLAERIERIDGVSGIWRNGIRDRELRVDVDPDRLVAHQLSLTSVTQALRLRAANVPAGTTKGGGDTRLVRGMTRVDNAVELAKVVIRPDPMGGSVRVGDVAEVQDTLAPGKYSGRVNGEPAIVLTVRKDEQSDSIRISESVHALVDDFRKTLPQGVTIDTFGDAAHEVERSLDTLYANAAAGLLLVLLLLWVAIGARNAMMAAVGLPVALAGAIVAMDMMGITINMMSLVALILCLGVVVDDAIIIIENIYRHMEEGMPRRRAAVVGTEEVFWPVVSSTLTSWAAFLPLLLMEGVLGQFFAIIPKVVVAALAASLIEAMFILPSHMADFGKLGTQGGKSAPPETRFQRAKRRITVGYERVLRWSLQHRATVVFGCYALCGVLIVGALATKDVILFNEGDVDMFDVRVRMPTDASKEETEQLLAKLEDRIRALENADIEATLAVRGMARTDMGIDTGDHMGMVTVFVVPATQRSSLHGGRDLFSQVSGLYDDVVGPARLEVVEVRPGPPRGAPVAVRVRGNDQERLVELAEQVLAEVRRTPGTRNANHDYELGKQELQIKVDEERAALNGLTPEAVSAWLRSAFGATPAATLRDGDDEIDIVVQLAEEVQSDPERIASLRLITPTGDEVALREIADVTHGRGAGEIQRYQQKRMVSVLSNIDEEVTNSGEVNSVLKKKLAPLEAANPDIRFEYGGQWEETQESVESLFQAFVIAMLLIYTILATQFQSFSQPAVVMAAIPLSFIGVSAGFLLTAKPVGLIALVGVVGLTGIVVNDSLVLVDFINKRRQRGMALDEAIVEAGRLRLRPIFLTSVTTIAGLLPLSLASESLAHLAPMAQVIVWGLTFSTVLTLLVVPCLYRLDIDLAARASDLVAPFKRWVTDPGAAKVEDTADTTAD
ncbi:MAG: efflux RND transporter permease subunit [Myxococcales bacterium]|nr:efflux RND transporter permease subunit [Myxococcales bacterium]MDH3485982.1 efflux RND transporter permease subunit [Myxococcales bacterium]